MGARLSVSRQAVSKWESGQAVPDIANIIAMCALFKVSADYLLMGKEEPAPVPAAEKGHGRRSLLFKLGALLAGIGIVGVLAFLVLSVIHPWEVLLNGYVYSGLLGFLIGSESLPLFLACLVIFAGGLALSVRQAVKKEGVRRKAE